MVEQIGEIADIAPDLKQKVSGLGRILASEEFRQGELRTQRRRNRGSNNNGLDGGLMLRNGLSDNCGQLVS